MSDNSKHSLVVTIDGREQVFWLGPGSTTIGRSSKNTVPLRESSVSRFHCTIDVDDDEVRLADVMSRNATRLRRKSTDRVKSAHGRRLRDGDTLFIGRLEVLFRAPAKTAAAPSAPVPTPGTRPDAISSPVVGAVEFQPPATGEETVLKLGVPAAASVPTAGPGPVAQPTSSGSEHTSSRGGAGRRRRRNVTSSRQKNELLSMVAALVFLAVIGGILYVAVTSSRSENEPSKSSVVTRDDDASRQRELRLLALLEEKEREHARTQSQIDELRKLQKDLESALARAEDGNAEVTVDRQSQKRLVETREALSRLVQREQALSGEVDELRIRPIGVDEETHLASVRRRREAMRPGRTVGIIENIIDDTDDSDSTRTIVAEVPKPVVELSKEDYGDLIRRLKESVGNYGLPYASPRDLDPDLPRLVAATGDQGARGVIEVYEYSQELMRNLDTTVGMLQRRVDGLLAKAQSDYGGSTSAASKSKSGGGYYKPQHSQYVEQLQRLLELSDKKIDIKKDQRDRLIRFQDKLGEAFGQLGSVEATRYLAKEFSRQEKNPALRTRMLASFRQGRTLHAVPALIKGLKARDMKLKSSVEATLVAITGVKLGDARAPWEAWWKANGDG